MSKNSEPRSWHWFSTPHTTDALELSVLALTETTIAMAIYVFIALKGYSLHLFVALCIAPFLLLRTPASTKLALDWAAAWVAKAGFLEKPDSRMQRKANVRDRGKSTILRLGSSVLVATVVLVIVLHFSDEFVAFILVIAGVFLFLAFALFTIVLAVPLLFRGLAVISASLAGLFLTMVALALRCWATICTAIRSPVESIANIPLNWWRIVGCVDLYHPPEPIPGYLTSGRATPTPHSLLDPLGHLLYSRGEWVNSLFRWSLKGSALIYLPILWIVHRAVGGDFSNRLRNETTWAVYKCRLLVSAVVVMFVGSKVLLFPLWKNYGPQLQEFSDSRFIELFVAPLHVGNWRAR